MRSATRSPNLHTPAGGRRGMKAARRAVVVQCDRCSCKGTGTINYRQRLVSVSLPARFASTAWLHVNCGGTFLAFDLRGSDG